MLCLACATLADRPIQTPTSPFEQGLYFARIVPPLARKVHGNSPLEAYAVQCVKQILLHVPDFMLTIWAAMLNSVNPSGQALHRAQFCVLRFTSTYFLLHVRENVYEHIIRQWFDIKCT
jgi:hypothetical protein